MTHNFVPNPGLSSDPTFSFVVFAHHLDSFIITQNSQSLPGLAKTTTKLVHHKESGC
jgi:hypothetical protein